LQVAVHFAFLGQVMLQVEGFSVHLLSHVAPSPHATLFPDFAVVSSLLHATIASESRTAAVMVLPKCMKRSFLSSSQDDCEKNRIFCDSLVNVNIGML